MILDAQQEGLETKRERDLAIVAHESGRMTRALNPSQGLITVGEGETRSRSAVSQIIV